MNRGFVFFAAYLVPLVAFATDFSVGDSVFVKPGAVDTVEGQPVDSRLVVIGGSVGDVQEYRLLLKKTWVHRHDVMTVDEAIAFYNEHIRSEPQNASFRVTRGVAWSEKENFNKGLSDINEAIRLDPKYANAYECRSRLCLKTRFS